MRPQHEPSRRAMPMRAAEEDEEEENNNTKEKKNIIEMT
jgi:hypothetical protein